jgi:hypothetical protein
MDASESATTWAGTLNMLSSRFPIVLTVLGFAFEPYRGHLEMVGDRQVTVQTYLDEPTSSPETVVVIVDVESSCVMPGHNNLLGRLRERVMAELDRGQRFILISRYPRSRYPDIPGSSLLEDAKMHLPQLLETTAWDDPLPLPVYATGACIDLRSLFSSILLELGTEIISLLDHALFETFEAPARVLDGFLPREVEALLGSGLVVLTQDHKLAWAFPRRILELKEALAHVVSGIAEIGTDLGPTFSLLFSLERQIRSVMRTTARAVWGESWRSQLLNGSLPSEVLKRAIADSYPAAKSLKELRDPLEWLTFSELLLLRERKEFGSLGMDPVLWRRLAAEVSPIRNRLTHMRLLRSEDLQVARRWSTVVSRKLKPTPQAGSASAAPN